MRPRSRSAPYVCDCVGVFVSLWEPVRELEPEKWGLFFLESKASLGCSTFSSSDLYTLLSVLQATSEKLARNLEKPEFIGHIGTMSLIAFLSVGYLLL